MSDPLDLGGLEPAAISAAIEKKAVGKSKPASELELKKEARLASKEQRLHAKVEPPAAPAPTPAPEVDKSALLDQLHAYRDRFPSLKRRNNVTVKSSLEDIHDELHYYAKQLGSKDNENTGALLLHGAMLGLETLTRDVWNPLRLDLTDLGRVTKANMSEFQPIIDELMIKYGSGMYVGPELRLAIAVGATVATVHAANSGNVRVADALERMHQPVRVPEDSKDL